MDKIAGENFDCPDETRRPFEKSKIEVITVGGESCQKFHVKIFLKDRQRMLMIFLVGYLLLKT
jgi:hypothetical protein